MRFWLIIIALIMISSNTHSQTLVTLLDASVRIHTGGIADIDVSYDFPLIVLNGEVGFNHYQFYEQYERYTDPVANGRPWSDFPYQTVLWEAQIFGYGYQNLLYAAGIPYGNYYLAKGTWTQVGGCFRDQPFDYNWCVNYLHGGWPERTNRWDFISVPEQS